MTKEELLEIVQSSLSQKRVEHTLAVAKLSVELADKYDTSQRDAYLAAMLHDITKETPKSEQLQTIIASDIINSNILNYEPELFHSITAYLKARNELCLENEDVLNAIRYHTTGRKGMSLLEKIIFTADACSYDRDYGDASRIRELAFVDINKAMLEVVEFTLIKLVRSKKRICIDEIECYNSCIQL